MTMIHPRRPPLRQPRERDRQTDVYHVAELIKYDWPFESNESEWKRNEKLTHRTLGPWNVINQVSVNHAARWVAVLFTNLFVLLFDRESIIPSIRLQYDISLSLSLVVEMDTRSAE